MDDCSYHASLRLLGGHVLVRCLHRACRDGIVEHFGPHRSDPTTRPDVQIECRWPKAGRYLFEARPAECAGSPLEGVRVHLPGRAATCDWMPLEPPIPPFPLPPFNERFVGLHAAALAAPGGGGVLVIGERGAGKTTTTLTLDEVFGYHVLSDGTTCLHRRTRMAEPYLPPPALFAPESPGHTRAVPAPMAFRHLQLEPQLVTHLIFLTRLVEGVPSLIRLEPVAAFRLLLDHQIHLGCTLGEEMVTLTALAHDTARAEFRYTRHGDLLQAIPRFHAFVASPRRTHGVASPAPLPASR